MIGRKGIAYCLIFLLIFSYSSIFEPVFAEDTVEDTIIIGPGHTTDLCVQREGGEGILEELPSNGKVYITNTKNELIIHIDTAEGFEMTNVEIYAGYESVPTSEGGAAKHSEFPYKEKFETPQSSYELVLKLEEDLGVSWGQKFEERRLLNISVFTHLVPDNKKSTNVEDNIADVEDSLTNIEAWAFGANSFDASFGWWDTYMAVHPKTGHLVDAPVSGVDYKTPSQHGSTDLGGAFSYIPGEEVTFSIADLELGTTLAKHQVTPLDIMKTTDLDDERVVNMARLLQTLDSDGEPGSGISITELGVESLKTAAEDSFVSELNFEDSGEIETLLETTVELANASGNKEVKMVSKSDAKGNLESGTSGNIFRKNISKTAEQINTKAKLELMPIYVPALKADDTPVELEYLDSENEPILDDDGQPKTFDTVKPLVVVYTEEHEETGASDVIAAISRDEGNTWKRTNLSKSADKSSIKLKNGEAYYGDVNKPQVRVRDNYILAVWTSKYARSGKPRYSIRQFDEDGTENSYYVDDIWGVSGPQRSCDYSDDFPEVGEIPYSCVWTARGMIDKETGAITWFKSERLTSGRRDANQIMMGGIANGGFALVWQEDPKGLKPGEQAGPGEGWSGATVNHKTDIWYSYIPWGDFATPDETFVSGGTGDSGSEDGGSSAKQDGTGKTMVKNNTQSSKDEVALDEDTEDDEQKGRLKALVPFTLPIRLSDNAPVNSKNLKATLDETTGIWTPNTEATVTDDEEDGDETESDKIVGTHRYGYEVDGLFDHFYEKTNNQGVLQEIAVTEDGRLLDGDTGAARPNIKVMNYGKDSSGNPRTWVIVAYEETKGLGAGPPDMDDVEGGNDGDSGNSGDGDGDGNGSGSGDGSGDHDSSTSAADTSDDLGDPDLVSTTAVDETSLATDSVESISSPDDSSTGEGKSKDGTGAQRGKDAYVADLGKNAIFHTFEMSAPELVSAGTILNPPTTDENGEDVYLVNEDESEMLDFEGERILAYENARRPRFIIQSGKAAMESENKVPLVCVFRMGEEGKGRQADVFIRRWVMQKGDENPYALDNLVPYEEYCENLSASTPIETWVNPDSKSSEKKADDEDAKEAIKVLRWVQTEDNLKDKSSTNPYDNSLAQRGIIKGDFIAIAYDSTPNWTSARNGNDVYNLYIRRSFNGGETWTTDPDGDGVTHTDTFKTETSKTDHDRYTVETTFEAGEFEAARNVSQLRNNKTSTIEPRLVGVPGTIVGSEFDVDTQDINSFWVTYGTEANVGRKDDAVGGPLDLYYSFTSDRGESYNYITKTIKSGGQGKVDDAAEVDSQDDVLLASSENSDSSDSSGSGDGSGGGSVYTEGDEIDTWDWLAKDTGKKVSEQAECQIRMPSDGSILYAVWNEKGEDTCDVMFRRIARDGSSIEVVESVVVDDPNEDPADTNEDPADTNEDPADTNEDDTSSGSGSGSGGSSGGSSVDDSEDPIVSDVVASSSESSKKIDHRGSETLISKNGKLKVSIEPLATDSDMTMTINEAATPSSDESDPSIEIQDMIYRIEATDESGEFIESFNNDLELEFTYEDSDIPMGFSAKDLKIAYFDKKQGKWIAIPSNLDLINKKIIAKTDHLSFYSLVIMKDFPSLEDVWQHWADTEIYKMASLNIICGDPDGKFRPNDVITREEMAKEIAVASGLKVDASIELLIGDADAISDWAVPYVAAAVNAGFMEIYEDQTFRPNDIVSRADVARIIIKARGDQPSKYNNIVFSDMDQISEENASYIMAAVQQGLIFGFPDGTCQANDCISRAECAAIMARHLDTN